MVVVESTNATKEGVIYGTSPPRCCLPLPLLLLLLLLHAFGLTRAFVDHALLTGANDGSAAMSCAFGSVCPVLCYVGDKTGRERSATSQRERKPILSPRILVGPLSLSPPPPARPARRRRCCSPFCSCRRVLSCYFPATLSSKCWSKAGKKWCVRASGCEVGCVSIGGVWVKWVD